MLRAELRLFYVIVIVCLGLGFYATYSANHKSYLACQRTEQLVRSLQRNAFVPQAVKPKPCDRGFLGLF